MLLTIIWAVVLVGLVLAAVLAENEVITRVAVWFAAGAAAALVISFLGDQLVWLQVIVFCLVAGIFLFLLRPMIRKNVPLKLQYTNVEAIPGKYAPVTVAIDNIAGVGEVKLDGMVWMARSTDGQPIEEGTVVCIHHVEGVKLFVFPVAEEFTAG
ncbi:MAG: NfeD family protein [Ruminococcaceae bacterium]|nr:NfeD family protein [Oscillospiraceae bacterium]